MSLALLAAACLTARLTSGTAGGDGATTGQAAAPALAGEHAAGTPPHATRGAVTTLAAATHERPGDFLAGAAPIVEPIAEREGPQARLGVRGIRIIRGAPLPRRDLKPDAPRFRSRERQHLDALPALAAARAGALPFSTTSLPPPPIS